MNSIKIKEVLTSLNISFSMYPDETTFVIPKQELESDQRRCFCGKEGKICVDFILNDIFHIFFHICSKCQEISVEIMFQLYKIGGN